MLVFVKVNAATHAPDPSTLPTRETGSYFASAAAAAAAADKLFQPKPAKPPKPPKVKPAAPEPEPEPEIVSYVPKVGTCVCACILLSLVELVCVYF